MLEDPSPELRREALLALNGWPDASPAPDLLKAAERDSEENLRILALRAYIAVVSLPSPRSKVETVRLLQKAVSLAAHPEGRKAVLSALTGFLCPEALALARDLAADRAVAAEANQAIEALERGIRAGDGGLPLRLLVVTGGHEYPTTFYKLFDDPRFHWTHAVSSEEAFRSDIRQYDVLVLYDSSRSLSDHARENLLAFLESGKGVVILHHAIADYGSWPAWLEVVGGRWTDHCTYKHDQDLVITAARPHPITDGLTPIHITDEVYKNQTILPGVQVLLETDHPDSDRAIAWVSPYPKSRVVYISLGHDEKAHLNPGYRDLVHRAILWTANDLPIAQARASYQVVHGWPVLPKGFSFGHISGLDVDSHNHVWLFHRGALRPIMALDGRPGEVVASFGEGMFRRPHGLRVDPDDNIWVTDKDDNVIYKFSPEGCVLMTVGTKGEAGQDATHFNGVSDLAFTPQGDFYVADGYVNNRIAKFSKEGRFLFKWGSKGTGPGRFDLPHGVALDAGRRVYVTDRGNSRVQIFDEDGKLLREWKGPEYGCPWGITVGPDGFIYLVDGGDAYQFQSKTDPNPTRLDHAAVLKLDPEGGVVARIGDYGRYDGQFIWPHCVAIAEDGTVYISDVHTGMRVQKFVKR
jgi:type 1 glutamine amidotransferase/DNA-binding beta-propeller fold protein YncE